MCEEFSCVRSVAIRELEEDAEGVFEILRLRAYARAKQAYDQAGDMSLKQRTALMNDPIVQLVQETEFALVEEERDRQANGG